jgi:diguanylate cyclase (GGDEF)-like protein/PAS domain S-box-containing protein
MVSTSSGQRPRAGAAAGARGSTVGFFSPLVHGYYFGGLLAGVVDEAARAGGRVVAVQALDAGMQIGSAEADRMPPPLGWAHLDAFVIVQDAVPDAYARALRDAGKPVVFISHEVDGLPCPTVVPDNGGGIAAAVDHLVAHGHRRIGFAGGRLTGRDDLIRYDAYRTRLLHHGLRPDEAVMTHEADEEAVCYATGQRMAAAKDRPTAVVACTDVGAIGLIRALTEAGLSVPGDVAVIGFDDVDDAATHEPPLTTVAQSFTLIGSLAAQLALRQLRGEPVEPGHHLARTTLVLRETCGCPGTRTNDDAPQAACGDQLAADRFPAELIAAAEDDGVLTPVRVRDLTALGHRVVALFESVTQGAHLAAPASADGPRGGWGAGDVSVAVAQVAAETYRLAPCERSVIRIGALLRRLARTVAATRAPGDPNTAARLDDLSHELAIATIEHQMRGRFADYLQFRTQRQQYEISTSLLRRDNRDSRSLSWLDSTEVRAGCFAVWDGDGGADGDMLTVVGTYHDARSYDAAGERHPVRSFPPTAFLELIGNDPDELMYVLPVRFDGSDHGFLALVGSLEMRAQTALEMFNQWAVLLTVSLDQEKAVESLLRQRGDLVTAYERERTLVAEIRASEERYALAAQAANDGLWDWDLTGGTVFFSERWKSLMGLADHEVGTDPREWLDRVHPDDRPALDQALASQLDGETRTMELEHRVRAADGSYRWMLARGRAVQDPTGRVIRFVGSSTDITDRKLLQEQLRRDALHDALTGLPNRTLFLDRVNRAIELARRRPDYWFAVLFMDLNGFKLINDSLGHHAGDEALSQVAERLVHQMRTNDTAARFGGDEFAVLLNDVRAVADLPTAVDRLQAAIAAPMIIQGQTVSVSASVGITVSLSDYQYAEEFIRDADTAMYRAKAQGHGACVMFDESMHTGAMHRLQLEADLRKAVVEEQFELHYQPVVRLADRAVLGVEALIRWRHPTRGLVSPAEFLPVAETTGLVMPIGRWTIREACRQVRRWRAAPAAWPDPRVSLNLSNGQFWDPELRSTLQAALAEYEVPASSLVFEITEGVIMQNPDAAGRVMRHLRDDGFPLHVDDFGTGYSSLASLHTFPIDALKIDRSFIVRMTVDSRSRELVRIMIAMGRNLGVDVIAEGVETEEQAAMLAEMACPAVQGYLFARPLPAPQVSLPGSWCDPGGITEPAG